MPRRRQTGNVMGWETSHRGQCPASTRWDVAGRTVDRPTTDGGSSHRTRRPVSTRHDATSHRGFAAFTCAREAWAVQRCTHSARTGRKPACHDVAS